MVGLILLRGINTINFTLSPTMSNETDVKRLRPTIGDTFVFTKQEKRQLFYTRHNQIVSIYFSLPLCLCNQ